MVINPYPLPIIGEKQLEVFKYAKALDLNMGYYTIELFTQIKGTTNIVNVF